MTAPNFSPFIPATNRAIRFRHVEVVPLVARLSKAAHGFTPVFEVDPFGAWVLDRGVHPYPIVEGEYVCCMFSDCHLQFEPTCSTAFQPIRLLEEIPDVNTVSICARVDRNFVFDGSVDVVSDGCR